jgi:hypothetical protein
MCPTTLQESGDAIACIRVVSTVDFLVAAGSVSGVVTIFKIPRLPSQNKQVCRLPVWGIPLSFVYVLRQINKYHDI